VVLHEFSIKNGQYSYTAVTAVYSGVIALFRNCVLISDAMSSVVKKGKVKVYPCTGIEALYRPYGS
jgi:hypothetical protein